MIRVQDDVGVPGPLIFENGGGFCYDDTSPSGVVPLGTPVDTLEAAIADITGRLNLRVRTLLDMTVEEVAELTGLAPEEAARSRKREFSLPFVVVDRQIDAVALDQAARERGLRVTQGGRFYHLTGDSDKGEAVRCLRQLMEERTGRRTFAAGLGDSANDISLLRAVDWPVRIRNPWSISALSAEIEWASTPSEPGPAGWRRAVEQWLRECVAA